MGMPWSATTIPARQNNAWLVQIVQVTGLVRARKSSYKALRLNDNFRCCLRRTLELITHLRGDLAIDFCVRTIRLRGDDRKTRIRFFPDGYMQWNFSEERHAEAPGLLTRTSMTKDIGPRAAAWAQAAPDRYPVSLFVMSLFAPRSVANDRMSSAPWAPTRQRTDRRHPGSDLSPAAGSAIKRITAGVKARR